MNKNNTLSKSDFIGYDSFQFSDTNFKYIIEHLPAPIIIFDKNLCFVAASNRFFNESPLEKEQVQYGDHWYKLVPDMPTKWKLGHQRCLAGESVKSEEDSFHRQDGSVEWWKYEVNPWYVEGEIGGLILYVENITQQKKMEKELQENIHLLEKSNNNLSKFAHICAHDLHQSLRTISLYAQIVQTDYRDNIDSSLKKYIGHMIKTIDHMKNFISSTLDFSQSKNKNTSFSDTCMQEIINTVVMVLKDEIANQKATINYKHMPIVNADKNLISQIMQNLISNALKYRNELSPIIDIYAVDKGAFWMFSVQDNGIGIPTKYLKKIFSEYTRINPESQKGAGLGLHQCNKIIKEHGGRIWATSTLNKGTTIFFTLSKAQQAVTTE